MQLRTDRPGFALPVAVLAIGLVTAGVMAAFARTGVESRVIDNQQEQQIAFATATAGIEQYIADGRFRAADTLAGQTYDFADGTAQVRLRVMRDRLISRDTVLYVIVSVGTSKHGTVGAGRPPARRTVAQLAYRPSGSMQVMSAWTALSGLRKTGAAGDITGYDACTGASLPGVALPTGTFTGQDQAISGTPPIQEMGTQAEMAAGIKIDWIGITNPANPAISPTHVVCYPGTTGYDANWTPCGSWPTSTDFQDTGYWPVVLINGSKKGLPSNGRGTIIATGDFELDGGDSWDGIVLVGGAMRDNGTGAVAGAVVAGLNVLKGWSVDESSRAFGTKSYTYDSCKVAEAASSLARITPISNAWVDNWSSW
ncbi:hypothetical protein BH23GEM9_BH23GEM9_15250 [soil metagenome]